MDGPLYQCICHRSHASLGFPMIDCFHKCANFHWHSDNCPTQYARNIGHSATMTVTGISSFFDPAREMVPILLIFMIDGHSPRECGLEVHSQF